MDADALERLIAEIGTLRESVEELYLVLDHAWRNRQEIYDLLDPPSACSHCEDKNESDVEPSAANINGEVVEALRLLLQELGQPEVNFGLLSKAVAKGRAVLSKTPHQRTFFD